MNIEALFRYRDFLIRQFEKDFNEASKKFLSEEAKFKVGDYVYVLPNDAVGYIKDVHINPNVISGQMTPLSPTPILSSPIIYKIKIINDKINPSINGFILNFSEDEIKKQ